MTAVSYTWQSWKALVRACAAMPAWVISLCGIWESPYSIAVFDWAMVKCILLFRSIHWKYHFFHTVFEWHYSVLSLICLWRVVLRFLELFPSIWFWLILSWFKLMTSADGNYLVAGSSDLRLFDLSNKKRLCKFTGHPVS